MFVSHSNFQLSLIKLEQQLNMTIKRLLSFHDENINGKVAIIKCLMPFQIVSLLLVNVNDYTTSFKFSNMKL